MTRYAVVGGGIAGLAAAWELRRRDPQAEVTVLEAGHRLGGKLRSAPFAGHRLDEGADAFLARVRWGHDLARELGLADSLVSPATGRAFVAGGDELRALPAGLVLGVPIDAGALRRSGWLGEQSAAAVEQEPLDPPVALAGGDDADVSVGELVRSRLGDEVLTRLVDPLLGGINAGDSDRLSLRASAPQLLDAARTGSLVAGLRDRPPAAPGPVFWALPGGMTTLVDELVHRLRVAEVNLRTGVPVADLGAVLAGPGADGVVVATPAGAAGRLVAGRAPLAAGLLSGVAHASVALVALSLRRADVRHPLDGSGFLVPRAEGRVVTACSFASSKWAHLAGDGASVVLRASVGRFGEDWALRLDDDQLLEAVLADLDDLLGLAGGPLESRITRWTDGFPQYEPGHLRRLEIVESDLATNLPRVRLAGAAHRGIGIPACIRQGRDAAASLAS